MNSTVSRRARLNWIGVAIIVVGLIAAAAVWISQDRKDTGDDSDQLSLLDSRSGTRQLETLTGQSGVIAEEATEWFSSFFHGKRLAGTIAVVSVLTGLGCMLAADYLLPRLK